MSGSEKKMESWIRVPSIVLYDTGLCTREEDDPTSAVLYHRPRGTSVNTKTVICGQLAGVILFCKSTFAPPSVITTKSGTVCIKHYGRFVMMMMGQSKEWAESRLARVIRLLDAAAGGITSLWMECNQDHGMFTSRFTSLVDSILLHRLPDINFGDDDIASPSLSTSVSSGLSPLSDFHDDGDTGKQDPKGMSDVMKKKSPEVKVMKTRFNLESDYECVEKSSSSIEDVVMEMMHYEFDALPSVPMSKSGACAFLKAQQLLEMCQQHSGVFAGGTTFQNRVLNMQIEPDIGLVLTNLFSCEYKEDQILLKKEVQFPLPKDVALSEFNLSIENFNKIVKSVAKKCVKRKDKNSLRSEVTNKDLSSLRSALQNNSLHSYSSAVPPLNDQQTDVTSREDRYQKKLLDPLSLCAKISRNSDFLGDERPSRSLPGTPRKIRVSTMLPDVGSNSPDLRYKVLTSKRTKPGNSSNNTPRKVPVQNSFFNKLTALAAPSLKRKDYSTINYQNKTNCNIDNLIQDKENMGTINQCEINDYTNNKDVNIKNTKNKLNLHFAPDKINRPFDSETETKISREINGNIIKDDKTNIENSFKSRLIELHDDDESRSEESDISVLELGSYLESKENGNKLFEEVNRFDSSRSESSATNESGSSTEAEFKIPDIVNSSTEHLMTKAVLYTQRSSDMLLFTFMDESAVTNQTLIYEMYNIAASALPEIQKNLVKISELTEEREGDTFLRKSYSVLTALDLATLCTPLVIDAHRDFNTHPDLEEITLREGDSVVWGHRKCQTETFYQSVGPTRPGLPIPSDTMARIPHRAKRRLEKDHGITIL